MLKAAWKGKSYTSVLKSTVKIPLLIGSPLLPPPLPRPGMWLYRGETSGGVTKCPLFSQASGVGEGGGGRGYLRSNISPFYYLSWKVEGRKKNRLLFFGMYDTIIHPLILLTSGWEGSVGGVPQLFLALLLMLPAEIETVSVASGNFPTFFVRSRGG